MSWKKILIAATMLSMWAVNGDAYQTTSIDFGRGPLTLYIPAEYTPDRPVALVMLLHGYTASGTSQEQYFQMLPLVDEYSFLYLHPDGTTNLAGARFWNATNACCNFYDSTVDDSAYLRSIIDEIMVRYSVDRSRVFLVGHSNGGFMSYRMACDHAEVVTGIAGLAGATFLDAADCEPRKPVHVLQIHGTNDELIAYSGGCLTRFNCYPGAMTTVVQWAVFNGCDLILDSSAAPLDLDALIAGTETSVEAYTGCAAGGSAELWTIVGGHHSPWLSESFARQVIEHLYEQTRPLSPRRPSRRLVPVR